MVGDDEKSGETVCLIKFDGNKTSWHDWSIKTLQLVAKSKGLWHAQYAKNTKPIDNDAYLVSTDDDKKKMTYELNDKACILSTIDSQCQWDCIQDC